MSVLPTTIDTFTVTCRITDIIEDASTETAGYVWYRPLSDWLPMPGESPSTIVRVPPVKEQLVDGACSTALLAGIQWEASFKLQGNVAEPDPLVIKAAAGETVDLAAVVTARSEAGVTEKLVNASSKADKAALEELEASLPATYAAIPYRPASGRYLAPGGNRVTQTLNGPLGCWIDVPTAIAVDRIGFEVTAAGSGAAARILLYKRSQAESTMTLVYQGSNLAVTSTGVKEESVALDLAPGRYGALLVPNGEGVAASVRCGDNDGLVGEFADVTEATSDPRGGIHNGTLSPAPDAATTPTTITLTSGTRSYSAVVYLRVA